jgi:central glycolytic genes regulator
MDDLLQIQRQLLPDLLVVLRKRYEILRLIHLMQPVGRRNLTVVLSLTERVLRAEVDFLRKQGLIEIATIGMSLTHVGAKLLQKMEFLVKELFGFSQLEQELKQHLGIQQALIVPGDADQSGWVKKEMGRVAAQLLQQIAMEQQVVAVAGGTTMLAVAEMMTAASALRTTTFVPTRGGLGEDDVELEANFIVSLLAKNSGGRYRLLHLPEQLSDESYQSMLREPQIQAVLATLKQARLVLHGIGNAQEMALRRNSPPEVVAALEEKGAVGESLGFYFNQQGEIVDRIKTVGLQQDDLQQLELKIAVAGGKSKATAISAVCSGAANQVLITDEACAKEILA